MKIDCRDGIMIRSSVITDIGPIAQNMRRLDKDEIWAAQHKQPLNALMDGYRKSTLCFTVEHKGNPCAMFGVVPQSFLGNKARIWLLASNELCKCRRKLLKYDRLFVKYMLSYYPHLSNFIDIRNKVSIRWLEWCKAKFEEAKPYGVEGKLFHRFSFERT